MLLIFSTFAKHSGATELLFIQQKVQERHPFGKLERQNEMKKTRPVHSI